MTLSIRDQESTGAAYTIGVSGQRRQT
jgi:hypothetical protein